MTAEKKTLKLSKPVTVDGHEYKELEIVEPSTIQLESMDRGKGQIAKTKHLIAACAGVPPEVVEALRARDFMAASDMVNDFLGLTLPVSGE